MARVLLNLWCIKFIHRINILVIVDEQTPKHQLNLLLKSCTRLIIVEKNSLRCMVAFSLLHIFFHAALEHFETSNTVDMKLKGQGIWSIFQNASVTNIIAVINKLYPLKVYVPLSHSTASLITQLLLQALLFWSPIKSQGQLLENISVHTTVHVPWEIFAYEHSYDVVWIQS